MEGGQVLLLDEVSMIDKDCFNGIRDVLSVIDHSRRPNARAADCFGPVHVLLFGDFKSTYLSYTSFFVSWFHMF